MSKRTQNPTKPATPQEYRKPRADIYTLLLVIALMLILLATAALWMTMKDFDYMIKGGPNPVWNLPATHLPLDVLKGIV
jgi:hypothetical protein